MRTIDTAKRDKVIQTVLQITMEEGLAALSFDKLAKRAGAGTLVPITGFANSVTAPAVEYQKEGQVFGIGCKIFTIAGPVILYGIFASWALGLICWVLQMFGIQL